MGSVIVVKEFTMANFDLKVRGILDEGYFEKILEVPTATLAQADKEYTRNNCVLPTSTSVGAIDYYESALCSGGSFALPYHRKVDGSWRRYVVTRSYGFTGTRSDYGWGAVRVGGLGPALAKAIRARMSELASPFLNTEYPFSMPEAMNGILDGSIFSKDAKLTFLLRLREAEQPRD
jgi:hypothetical protein